MTTALVAALAALLLAAYTPAAPGRTTAADCPAPTATVATMTELQAAVDAAQPGDVVVMGPGRYDGNLTIERSGAKDNPIWLCGPRDAVIDGGTVDSGQVVRLADADSWRLVGFTVTNGQKGLILSGVNNTVLADLRVHHIGHEAIHMLSESTDNVVRDSVIHDTGLTNEMFGEGVYIGTARSNWRDNGPDYSNRNQVVGTTFYDTTAEAIDVKEGTKDGVIRGNVLDGGGNAEQADSWVTVKGQGYVVEGNLGYRSPEHGFESQEIDTDGSVRRGGQDNLFSGNVAMHDGEGYAFYTRGLAGVEVACDNLVLSAGPAADVPCVPDNDASQRP